MRSALPNLSVRLKLTLLYGGVFLLAGAGLLAVNYALVRSQLNLPFKTRIEGPESARRRSAELSSSLTRPHGGLADDAECRANVALRRAGRENPAEA